METEEQLQEEINKAESLYQSILSANAQRQQQIIHQEQALAQLQQQIDSIHINQAIPDIQSSKSEIESLLVELQQLNKSIQNAEEQLTSHATAQNSSISAAKQHNQALQQKNKITLAISDEQLQNLQSCLINLKKTIEEESGLSEQTNILSAKTESQIRDMSIQLSTIATSQHYIDEAIKEDQLTHHKEIASLQNQFQSSSRQLDSFNQQLAQAVQDQFTQNALLKQSTHNAVQLLSKQKTKIQGLKRQSDLTKSNIHKENQKQEEIQKNNNALEATLLKLDQQIKEKEVEVDTLKAKASKLKQQIKLEQERAKEQQRKAQKQKNPKQLINAAYAQNERLSRQRDRDQNILKNSINSRSTYVSKENLQILQRELSRQTNPKAVSLDSKTNQSEKLIWRNKQLKDSIKKLKRLAEEAQARQSKALNEAGRKKDNLVKDKLEIDKQVTEATYKLNEYIKKFPNHEQQKEEKRKDKVKKINSLIVETSPKRKKKEKQPQDEEAQFILLEKDNDKDTHTSAASQHFQNTKWYKRRSSGDLEYGPEKPLYQNRYCQAAALLFFILVVVVTIN